MDRLQYTKHPKQHSKAAISFPVEFPLSVASHWSNGERFNESDNDPLSCICNFPLFRSFCTIMHRPQRTRGRSVAQGNEDRFVCFSGRSQLVGRRFVVSTHQVTSDKIRPMSASRFNEFSVFSFWVKGKPQLYRSERFANHNEGHWTRTRHTTSRPDCHSSSLVFHRRLLEGNQVRGEK